MVKTLVWALGGVLFASSALAADLMPVKAPSKYVQVPVYNWTGFYAGAHLGFGHGRTQVSSLAGLGSVSANTKGFLGGGQIGYNLHTGKVVFGIEADISAADIDGSVTGVDSTGDVRTSTARIGWTSLLTGRLGYAAGQWLPYIKGGAAWGGTSLSIHNLTDRTYASTNKTRSGWTIGAGVEYALAPQWTLRAQYDYVDLGRKNLTLVDNTGVSGAVSSRQHVHQAKFGINYKFASY
jgi:outer membrane immunogenic protein